MTVDDLPDLLAPSPDSTTAPTAAAAAVGGPSTAPWTHHSSRPHFLPPSTATPPALTLVADTLELARDYRELVDTLSRLEGEYGRALSVAVRRLEGKLDAASGPLHRGFEGTLHAALRSHLAQLETAATLRGRHVAALAGQVAGPLAHVERRGAEAHRRLGAWARDVRARRDDGAGRVDKARGKYHAAVHAHQAAGARRAAAEDEVDGKAERAAAAAARDSADRKRAYLVALAGDGVGGLARAVDEGGGAGGWGEEARALYTHVHGTLADLFRVHAAEDAAHLAMLSQVLQRAQQGYDAVSAADDCAAYLAAQSARPALMPGDSDDASAADASLHASTSESPLRLRDRVKSSVRPPPLDAMRAPTFEPPPTLRDDTAVFELTLEARDWLVNRWVMSKSALDTVVGKSDDGGVLAVKELQQLKELCTTYSADRGLGDPDEMWEQRLALLRELGPQHATVAIARAEMDFVEGVLDCDPSPESPHDLAERTFPTPSPCSVCAQAVWSPLTPELVCRTCGCALHRKCALHVEPECTGARVRNRRRSTPARRGGALRRSLTGGAGRLLLRRSSVFADRPHGPPEEGVPDGWPAPTPERPGHTPLPLRDDELHVSPFLSVPELDRAAVADAVAPPEHGDHVRGALARVAHPYAAASDAEMSVAPGEIVRVVEPDLDGLGWVRVSRGVDGAADAAAVDGLVPLSYLAISGFSTPPLDGGSGRFVVAAYDFPPPSHPPGPGEARLTRGRIYELSDAGMAFAADWCELVVADPDAGGHRVRGFVPKTYVRDV